jgi:hypothetical protein
MLSLNNLVQAFLEPSPSTSVARAQRLLELVHCYRGDSFGFALEAPLPQHLVTTLNATLKEEVHTVRYEVRFQIVNEIELHVTDELLWVVLARSMQCEIRYQIGGPVPKGWRLIIARESGRPIKIRPETKGSTLSLRLPPNELALKNLPRDETLFPASVCFIRMLQGTILYKPDVLKLQQDSRLVSTRTILPDASNLPWMVLDLQQEHAEMFDSWVDHVQTVLPHLKHIEAIRREDGVHAYLQVTYDGEYTVSSSGLSAGTLRTLALTVLPYLSNPPGIVCLEIPENSIHPQAIEAILQSLSSMYNSQVCISTHSPIVLAHTDLPSLIIMRGDGNNGIQAISGEQHPRLGDWRGEIDLGTLFAAGVFE